MKKYFVRGILRIVIFLGCIATFLVACNVLGYNIDQSRYAIFDITWPLGKSSYFARAFGLALYGFLHIIAAGTAALLLYLAFEVLRIAYDLVCYIGGYRNNEK